MLRASVLGCTPVAGRCPWPAAPFHVPVRGWAWGLSGERRRERVRAASCGLASAVLLVLYPRRRYWAVTRLSLEDCPWRLRRFAFPSAVCEGVKFSEHGAF